MVKVFKFSLQIKFASISGFWFTMDYYLPLEIQVKYSGSTTIFFLFLFFFFWGGEQEKMFLHAKICCFFYQFYAEIIKFCIILTHFQFFFFGGGNKWEGKKYFGVQISLLHPCGAATDQVPNPRGRCNSI